MVERRRIGNTALTTGMLLGFGVGDFTPEYLDQHLLSTFEPEVERLAAEWAFIECALVVSRPAAARLRVWGVAFFMFLSSSQAPPSESVDRV